MTLKQCIVSAVWDVIERGGALNRMMSKGVRKQRVGRVCNPRPLRLTLPDIERPLAPPTRGRVGLVAEGSSLGPSPC